MLLMLHIPTQKPYAFMQTTHIVSIYLVSVSLVRLLLDMATASFPDISSVPHQPTSITFPKRSFGKKVVARLRTFQASSFRTWKWIHYDKTNDKAFCFYSMKGFKKNKLKTPNVDQAFVSTYKDISCAVVNRVGEAMKYS